MYRLWLRLHGCAEAHAASVCLAAWHLQHHTGTGLNCGAMLCPAVLCCPVLCYAVLQASSLLQLFLRPSPINLSRQRQGGAGGAAGIGAPDGELPTWAEEGGDEEGSWGGADDGYEYDGDGAEGYNAGKREVLLSGLKVELWWWTGI